MTYPGRNLIKKLDEKCPACGCQVAIFRYHGYPLIADSDCKSIGSEYHDDVKSCTWCSWREKIW